MSKSGFAAGMLAGLAVAALGVAFGLKLVGPVAGTDETGNTPPVIAAAPLVREKQPASGLDAVIAGIRRDFQRIEALGPDAHQHTFALEGFSAEGGEARVFVENGGVAKIAVSHLGEMGRSLEDFYFRNGSLIFVFRRSQGYDRPFGQVQSTEEDRFYFDRGRMVRWRGANQNVVPRGNVEYPEQEENHLRFAERLLDAARSHSPSLAAPE